VDSYGAQADSIGVYPNSCAFVLIAHTAKVIPMNIECQRPNWLITPKTKDQSLIHPLHFLQRNQ
jgi:hypothetical protein